MDYMVMEFALSPEVKDKIIAELKRRNLDHACCSACDSPTDLSFLRTPKGQHYSQSMCVPCFLNNYTDLEDVEIQKVVAIGEKNGWYF